MLEGVTMQVDRVVIATVIGHFDAVTLAGLGS